MALITLVSAAGAPGVTSSALALALAWPRPTLLVEADPVGGSAVLAGYLQGQQFHDRGLIDLAMAHRQGGGVADTLRDVAIALPDSSVQLIAGARSHAQALTVLSVWDALTPILKGLERTGTDVIVDAGRLGMAGSPSPAIRHADLALIVLRSTLPAVAAARGWAKQLTDEFDGDGARANLGLLLVGDGRPYTARQVSKVLHLPMVASIPHDPVSAEVYHLGASPRRRFDTAPLPRSAKAAVGAIQAVIADNRQQLAGGLLPDQTRAPA